MYMRQLYASDNTEFNINYFASLAGLYRTLTYALLSLHVLLIF